MSWTNLKWEYMKVWQTSFYCICCDNGIWYRGTFWEGKDYWDNIKALLCDECKIYIGTTCSHCHPDDEDA